MAKDIELDCYQCYGTGKRFFGGSEKDCSFCDGKGFTVKTIPTTPEEDERDRWSELIDLDPTDDVTRKVFADWCEERGFDDYATIQRNWTIEKYNDALSLITDLSKELVEAGSERFPEDALLELDVEQIMTRAHRFLNGDCNRATMYLWFETPDIEWDKFWDSFMILTGRPVSIALTQWDTEDEDFTIDNKTNQRIYKSFIHCAC